VKELKRMNQDGSVKNTCETKQTIAIIYHLTNINLYVDSEMDGPGIGNTEVFFEFFEFPALAAKSWTGRDRRP
jgi:hypothetical protein